MGQQISFALHQSMHRVLLVLVSIFPGIASFLAVFLLFTLLGMGLSALLRKILEIVRFDERVAARQGSGSATGVGDWSQIHSPTVLASRIVFWASLLTGIAVGIAAVDAAYPTHTGLALLLFPYLTHVVGAILLLLAGSLVARFLARSVLIGAVNAQLQYARFLSLGVKWLVLVLTAAMALDHLQLGGNIVELAFGILFGGIVLTMALAVGLGSRDLVSRSLERSVDAPAAAAVNGPAAAARKANLRHF